MSYEIYIVKQKTFERIERVLHDESFNWQDDLENIFISFDFTCEKKIEPGSWIELYEKDDDKTVFYGIITKPGKSQKHLYHYSGYDIGFFIEKNKIKKQFRNSKISNAIKEVCKYFEIPTNEIPEIEFTISKIYKNTSISDILKELLQFAISKGLKREYYYDCMNGSLNLYKYSINNNLRGYVANIYSLKSVDTISSFEKSSSIEELKNQIEVISSVTKNKQTSTTTKFIIKDEESIKRYGILQDIIEVDADEKTNYRKAAEEALNEKNKVCEETSLTSLGDYNLKKGVIIPIENEIIELSGNYLVTSSRHNIHGKKEEVQFNIKKYNL